MANLLPFTRNFVETLTNLWENLCFLDQNCRNMDNRNSKMRQTFCFCAKISMKLDQNVVEFGCISVKFSTKSPQKFRQLGGQNGHNSRPTQKTYTHDANEYSKRCWDWCRSIWDAYGTYVRDRLWWGTVMHPSYLGIYLSK